MNGQSSASQTRSARSASQLKPHAALEALGERVVLGGSRGAMSCGRRLKRIVNQLAKRGVLWLIWGRNGRKGDLMSAALAYSQSGRRSAASMSP